jgi:hypothetical protein
MARTRSVAWTVFISLLLGIVAATAFWLYSPYGQEQLTGKKNGEPPKPDKLASQAMGSHFQMVADGKQVFVVDLKNGRAWRYYHQTKEQGFSRVDEGFLPIPFYYAGKKHYSASEIQAPSGDLVNPSTPAPEEKQSQ